MANILVTGGAGYVGSHACKALSKAGHLPITYDNLSTGHKEAVKWGPLEIGDVLDSTRLSEVMSSYELEAVMHFAALAIVSESVAMPDRYFRNNVEGTKNLLDTMESAQIKRIVFSSTCAVYGTPERAPISETESTKPINPYGESKLRAEEALAERSSNTGLSSICLRYFNAAGADQGGEIGEDHDPEPHLIPNVLSAAENATKLIVYGNNYPTNDGTCVRDYIHVADLADAHLAALDSLTGSQGNMILNLGSGQGHSVMQVIKAAESITAKPVLFEFGPNRPGDPPTLVAETSLARDYLGWRAKRSSLDTIVSDAWRWTSRR